MNVYYLGKQLILCYPIISVLALKPTPQAFCVNFGLRTWMNYVTTVFYIAFAYCLVYHSMFQRWRRRYFVLYWTPCNRVDCPNPRTAILSYYENENCFKQNEIKGNVDLVHCKEIHSHVKTHSYEHAFSLRTLHKQSFRLYCLAADTNAAMERWFRSVYEVLQLIQGAVFFHFDLLQDNFI